MPRLARIFLVASLSVNAACSTVPAQQDIKTFSDGLSDFAAYRATALSGQREAQQRRDRVVQRLDRVGFTPNPTCARGGADCALVQRSGRVAAGRSAPVIPTASVQAAQASAPLGPDGRPLDTPPIPDVCRPDERSSILATVTPEALGGGATVGGPAPDGSGRPTEQDIFAALDEYAAALRAVSNADDRAALDAANAKLVASVTTIATTVGTAAGGVGALAGPIAGAVTGLVLEVRTALLERNRLVALRTAVRVACVPVRTLALAAGLILEGRRSIQLGLDNEVMGRAAQLSLAPGKTAAAAGSAEWAFAVGQEAATSASTLEPHPWAAAKALVAAHNDLVATVVSGQGQGLEFLKTAGTFARSMKTLREAAAAGQGSKEATK